VFHHRYYDAVARVKCSLSRSDGDSNWFLTSWWFIPHTNHTHWSSELYVTNDTISVSVARQTGAAIPRGRPTARNQATSALELTLRAPVIPPSAPIRAPMYILARIVSLASRSKGTLFGQLNVRHAFNMIRGTSNDRSLTDTDRNYKHPRTMSGCPQLVPLGLLLSIHTWLFPRYHLFHS
jgi:hypothetical protein